MFFTFLKIQDIEMEKEKKLIQFSLLWKFSKFSIYTNFSPPTTPLTVVFVLPGDH